MRLSNQLSVAGYWLSEMQFDGITNAKIYTTSLQTRLREGMFVIVL
jgi:hypothetical protein